MAKQQSAAAVMELEPAVQTSAPAPSPTQPPVQPVVPAPAQDIASGEYTRCWEVKDEFRGTSYYGSLRVLADTEKEAADAWLAKKCPEDDGEVRKQLRIREIPFRPAATEVGKPGGWKRNSKVRQPL